MKTSRLWYIVMIGGAVLASSMVGCKKEQIERHRVAKLPAEEQVAKEPSDVPQTNAGSLPEGHPDVGAMTPQQMQAMAKAMPEIARSQGVGGLDVTFDVPEGWTQKLPPGAMLLHEFTAGQARMTVSMLGGNGGGLLANVNRWCGQLGLEAFDQEGLMQVVKPVMVDGVEGWRVELAGRGEEAMGTIGVIVERSGAAWFFKMNGGNVAVKSQSAAFEAFMHSVKWKS